jgi:hypothetical protein
MGHVVRFFTTGFPFSSVGVDHSFSWTGGILAGLPRSRFVECRFPGVILTADSGGPRNDQENHRDVRGRANSYFLGNVQLHFPRESSKRSREKCRGFSSAVAPHRHQPSREKPYAIMCTTILWKPVTPENGPGMCSCKRAEIVDVIMAGSFAIRQSKTLLAAML